MRVGSLVKKCRQSPYLPSHPGCARSPSSSCSPCCSSSSSIWPSSRLLYTHQSRSLKSWVNKNSVASWIRSGKKSQKNEEEEPTEQIEMKIREISDETIKPVTKREWEMLESGTAPSDFDDHHASVEDDDDYYEDNDDDDEVDYFGGGRKTRMRRRTIEYEMIEVKERDYEEQTDDGTKAEEGSDIQKQQKKQKKRSKKRRKTLNKILPSRVWSWGWGLHGSLGHGTYDDVFIPKPLRFVDDMAMATLRETKHLKATVESEHVSSLSMEGETLTSSNGSAVDIDCGWASSLLLDATGRVYKWGWCDDIKTMYSSANLRTNAPEVLHFMQAFGQTSNLGWVFFDSGTREPKLVMDLKDIIATKIRTGGATNFVLGNDGRVYSWGTGRWGQLGHKIYNHYTEEFPRPVVIERLLGQRIVDMACGYAHSLFLDDTGCLWTCGCGLNGRLGLGAGSALTEMPIPRPMSPLWRQYLKTTYIKNEKYQYITDSPVATTRILQTNSMKPSLILGEMTPQDHFDDRMLIEASGGEVKQKSLVPALSDSSDPNDSNKALMVGSLGEKLPMKKSDRKVHGDITLYEEIDYNVYYDEKLVKEVEYRQERGLSLAGIMDEKGQLLDLSQTNINWLHVGSEDDSGSDDEMRSSVNSSDEEEENSDDDHIDDTNDQSEGDSNQDDSMDVDPERDARRRQRKFDRLQKVADRKFAEENRLLKAKDVLGYDLPEIYKFDCGHKHNALLSRDGHVYCYGAGNMGALGQGPRDFTDKHWPARVTIGGLIDQFVVDVVCGQNHTVCMTSNGDIYTWGMGRHGQCGRSRAQAFMLEDVRERGANLTSVRHRPPYKINDDDVHGLPMQIETGDISKNEPHWSRPGWTEDGKLPDKSGMSRDGRSLMDSMVDQDDGILLRGDPLCMSPGKIQNFPASLKPWRIFAGFYQTTIITECGKAVVYGDELQRLENEPKPYILKLPQKIIKLAHGWKHHMALTVSDEQFELILMKELNDRRAFYDRS